MEEEREDYTNQARRELDRDELKEAVRLLILALEKHETYNYQIEEQLQSIKETLKEELPKIHKLISNDEKAKIRKNVYKEQRQQVMRWAKFIVSVAAAGGIVWAVFRYAVNIVIV